MKIGSSNAWHAAPIVRRVDECSTSLHWHTQGIHGHTRDQTQLLSVGLEWVGYGCVEWCTLVLRPATHIIGRSCPLLGSCRHQSRAPRERRERYVFFFVGSTQNNQLTDSLISQHWLHLNKLRWSPKFAQTIFNRHGSIKKMFYSYSLSTSY